MIFVSALHSGSYVCHKLRQTPNPGGATVRSTVSGCALMKEGHCRNRSDSTTLVRYRP
jgi:hypothetical protein